MRQARAALATLAVLLGAPLAVAQSRQPRPPAEVHRALRLKRKPSWPTSQTTASCAIPQPISPRSCDRSRPRQGADHFIEACRAMVERSAIEHGAARVEAASAGPQRRVRQAISHPLAVKDPVSRCSEVAGAIGKADLQGRSRRQNSGALCQP